MIKTIQSIIFVVLTAISTPTLAYPEYDTIVFDVRGEGKVAWVFDGDTFRIDPDNDAHIEEMSQYVKKASSLEKHFNWGQFTVRIANVNTAESTHKDPSKNTKEGAQISDIVKSKLKIGTRASYHCYKLGYYDRPVCNVTIKPKGEKEYDFAEWLIQNKYSPYIYKYGKNPFNHDNLSNI